MVAELKTAEAVDSLQSEDPNAYAQLSWLIAHGAMEIKLAFLKSDLSEGIYHEKFGLFSDGSDTVAFIGSLNETLAAVVRNFEFIDVFASWSDELRVREKLTYFERLWDGNTPRLDVMSFPAAVRGKLLRAVPNEYPADAPDADKTPHTTPQRELRPHQREALTAWRNNGQRGLLEMATGTGKTFTALSAISDMFRAATLTTAVILVPHIAIAEQWRDEAEGALGMVALVCHSQSGDWRTKLGMHVALSKFEHRPLVVIALYETASSDDFGAQASRFSGPILLVADEVHNVTSDVADLVLSETYDYRLGLSATPHRYLDPIGTAKVHSYFDRIVFEYSLADAIAAGILTPYDYYPLICGPRDELGPSSLTGVNAAKLNVFQHVFRETQAFSDGYTLVYCQPPQLEETKSFLGIQLGRTLHTFTAEEDRDQRRQILRDFGSGFYQVLVAMRCLDEGVDVPPTRSAFLLGSSENPKQFVQRRGRVLRRFPGKSGAAIYDFVYLPAPDNQRREDELRRELTRFAEFALSARNGQDAVEVVVRAAEARGIQLKSYITHAV
jgi:superfamily II DNA or RNA helicase